MTNNNEQKESMVFYRSFIDAISTFDDPQTRAECYEAIINYGLDGTSPNNTNPIITAMFKLIKPIINSNTERYQKSIENGKKGGAPTGNQNARKKDNSITLPNEDIKLETISLTNDNYYKNNLNQPKTTQNNLNQPKNNPLVFKTTKNNLNVNDNVNDNDNVNVNDNDTHNVNDTETPPPKTNNTNNTKPLTPLQQKFASVCEKFKKYFPNKNNKIKNWKDMNNINIEKLNIEKLIAKIDTCDFVKERNYLGLEWALLNYDNIINGVYDNPQNIQKFKQHEEYLKQNGFADDKNLNSLYDNIKEMSKELELEQSRQTNALENPFKQSLNNFF